MPHEPLNLNVDRRVFIKGLGYVSAGLFLATLGGCESCVEQIKNRPVRRRLRTGSAEVDAAIATYKDAVAAMKALPASNPRSWSAQAGIHGSSTAFNFCHHGTVHFFSWHRAYLVYFERICQELTGNKNFGLPYWNWNQNPQLHSEFTASGSPLFHPRVNTTVAGVFDFSNANLNSIFSDTNFFSFSDQLEGSPHNTAHISIGGDFGGFGSAIDPVFWAHHCMVDYCWAKWNIEMENDNTNDGAWNGTSWDHFVDGQGNQASATAGATTLMPLISYQYESSAIGNNLAEAVIAAKDFKKIEDRVRKGADVRFDVKQRVRIADQARLTLARPLSLAAPVAPRDFSAVVQSDSATERVFASIEWAQMPPANDFFVRVFLNLPGANIQTPTTDPHFAGSFAFFGTHHGKTDFLVNVTDTLKRIGANAGSNLSVQLVAVPANDSFARPDVEIVLEKIDLIVTPVLVRSE